jgi:hypothetical protein
VDDHEIANERRLGRSANETERARCMTGRRKRGDTGQYLLPFPDGDVHRNSRWRGRVEPPTNRPAAGTRAKLKPGGRGFAIAESSDDFRAGSGGNRGSGANMISVTVSQQDSGELTAGEIRGQLFQDRLRAGSEASIDEGEAPVGRFDHEDVGTAGAAEPPDTIEDALGHAALGRVGIGLP